MRRAILSLALFSLLGVESPRCEAAPPRDAQPLGIRVLLDKAAKFGGTEGDWTRRKPDVVSITFDGAGPTDAELGSLRLLLQHCPVPVDLRLTDCPQITDAGLEHLRDIQTITTLAVNSKAVTDEGLKHLGGLTNLEDLYLSNDQITDAGIAPLGNLTKLRKLSVWGRKLTEAAFEHLPRLVDLEDVHIVSEDLGDFGLKHMTGMKKLTELSIGGKGLTGEGLKSVAQITALKTLRIDTHNDLAAGFKHLPALKNLEVLSILSADGCTGDALAPLAELPNLRELELIYTDDLDRAGGKHLGRIKTLKQLRLDNLETGALEGLAGHAALEDLQLFYSELGDDDMQHLSNLPALRVLSISHTAVTDAGMKHLAGLPNLRDLSAGDNDLTDATLDYVSQIPNLEDLSVEETKVTGSGFKHLARLTKLKELRVAGCPVTDEHLAALANVPSLKTVYLIGTKTTEEAALALKQARPEVEVHDFTGDDLRLDAKPRSAPRAPPIDVAPMEPAFRMTAEALHTEYENNERGTESKYKGKVLELSGKVRDVTRNLYGESVVFLEVQGDLLGVTCATAEPHPWKKVVAGQQIKIKGVFPEFAIGPAIVYCTFVETGEYGAIRITSEALAKEFAADREATRKKYDDKHLVVTGKVVAKEFNSAGAAGILLETGNDVKVECSFTAFERDVSKRIKIGETVGILGEFTFNFAFEDDRVGIYFCLPFSDIE